MKIRNAADGWGTPGVDEWINQNWKGDSVPWMNFLPLCRRQVRARMHLFCCCVSLAVSSTARELRFCVGHGGTRILFTDSYSYFWLLHGTDLTPFFYTFLGWANREESREDFLSFVDDDEALHFLHFCLFVGFWC